MIYFEVDNENNVTLQHFLPFDEKAGLGKTEAELRKTGYLVDALPAADVPEEKTAVLKFNQETNTLYYEYSDRQPTLEDQLEAMKQENELLKAQNNAVSERADFIEELIAEMAMQIYQ